MRKQCSTHEKRSTSYCFLSTDSDALSKNQNAKSVMKYSYNVTRQKRLIRFKFLGIILVLLSIINSKPLYPQSAVKLESPSISYKGQDGKQVQLKVSKVVIDVKVVGKLAVTTMDMTYANSTSRVLEGELNFPLSEGQCVSRFALEINGKLREGVVVEKEKGRVVFESVVRKRIDPALLEMTRGNSFKSRIYPIPANGTKRVVLAYEETLQENADGMVYRLPLAFTEPIDTFRLAATVFGDCNILKAKTNQLDYTEFRKTGTAYVTAVEYKNYKADQQFEFMMASPENRQDVMTETQGNKTYFTIDLNTELSPVQLNSPSTLCVFWDVSGSRSLVDKQKEILVLKNYISSIKPGQITVVTFANEMIDSKQFYMQSATVDGVINYIQKLDYDGATRLSAIDPTKYPADQYLLFTDGISNFGKSELKPFSKPLYIINSNQNAEHDLLRYYAQKSGGAYINLLNKDANEALNLLTNQLPMFLSAEILSGDVTEVYPSIPTPVSGSFLLAGQLVSSSALVKLNFGNNGGITKSVTIDLNKNDFQTKTGLLGRIWAQKKLSELNMQYEKNKDAVTVLGKAYSIVTKNTSLIVLDRVEDYVRYQIEPPEELKSDYDRLLTTIKNTEIEDSIRHYNSVVRMFEEENKWWGKDYETIAKNMKTKNSTEPLVTSSNRTLYGVYTGTVKDSSGNGAFGATVRILNAGRGAIIRDSDGQFQIDNLIAGNYKIQITLVGNYDIIDEITIEPDMVTEKSYNLLPMPMRLEYISNSSQNVPPQDRLHVAKIDLSGVISLSQPVITPGGFYIRGSRTGDTPIHLDGLDVGNQFTGGLGYGSSSGINDLSNQLMPANVPSRSWRETEENNSSDEDNNSGYVPSSGGDDLSNPLMPASAPSRSWRETEENNSSNEPDYNNQLNPPQNSNGNREGRQVRLSENSSETMSSVSDALVPVYDSARVDNENRAVQRSLAEHNAKAGVSLSEYNPNAPYLETIDDAAEEGNMFKTYLEQKKQYGMNPGFYLDVADLFVKWTDSESALRVLSNIAELQLENQELMRILGHRLQQLGYYDVAESIFQEVLKMRGEEPQSYRDLALVLADAGKYQEAADLLYKVAMTKWDSRFPEVELIALNELNRLISRYPQAISTDKYDKKLLKKIPVDIRVVMNWDTDNCDIDLWVYDPDGEYCNYAHNSTAIGGKISRDFTGGYGPEEFMLRKAIPGKYKVLAKYYGSSSQKILGETTVQLELYIKYSTNEEVKKVTTVRLQKAKDMQEIGEFEF